MKKNTKNIRNKANMALILAALMLTGCNKSPESSIVANKDFDNMIDEAENPDNGVSTVSDAAANYDTYTTTINDESMRVNVNVDAKVEIPEADKMSVYRVKQSEISQDLIDKAINYLAPDVTFYDGRVLSIRTKSDIEGDMNYIRERMAAIEDGTDTSVLPEDKEVELEEWQMNLDSLQAEYENTQDDYTWSDYQTDCKLHSVSELYNRDTQDSFYSWEYDLNPNGEIFYVASDGSDGNYVSMYVQNNPDYGNCLRFRKSTIDYEHISGVYVDGNIGGGSMRAGWKASEAPEDGYTLIDDIDYPEDMTNFDKETAALSMDDAISQADNLMSELGLNGYKLYENDLYNIIPEFLHNSDMNYCEEYVLRYMRNEDGVFVNNDGGVKIVDEWQGDTYNKKIWGSESVIVYVNDNGIVGFDISSPMEIVETVVDGSSIKSFEDIKPIFEQMVVVSYAPAGEGTVNISVDSVILRYTRISEEDSFDTGLLVPVWEFTGTLTDEYGNSMNPPGNPSGLDNTSILTINAIDGSVIDRAVGY